MKKSMMVFGLVIAAAMAAPAFAQFRDAGSKIRGDYGWSGSSAGRSMQSARQYSHDYQQYVQSVPKATPEVTKEATDAIGQYIAKAQKHMAYMRKNANGGGEKQLSFLDAE